MTDRRATDPNDPGPFVAPDNEERRNLERRAPHYQVGRATPLVEREDAGPNPRDVSRLRELEKANAEAPAWGAAVGARNEEIAALRRRVSLEQREDAGLDVLDLPAPKPKNQAPLRGNLIRHALDLINDLCERYDDVRGPANIRCPHMRAIAEDVEVLCPGAIRWNR